MNWMSTLVSAGRLAPFQECILYWAEKMQQLQLENWTMEREMLVKANLRFCVF